MKILRRRTELEGRMPFMSRSEIAAGIQPGNMSDGNVWGQIGTLPAYTIAGVIQPQNPDTRPMLIKLSLTQPEFITIYCRAPLNDELLNGLAGYPVEEIIGHIQFGVGGFFGDADFDWLNGNRITVIAQSLQVTVRRTPLVVGAAPAADPGALTVAAWASPGSYGGSEATRTISYFDPTAAGLAPAAAWGPNLIPRYARKLAVNSRCLLANQMIDIRFLTQNNSICGVARIDVPYVDDITIPNAAKFFTVVNSGLVNTEAYMTFIFGLAL